MDGPGCTEGSLVGTEDGVEVGSPVGMAGACFLRTSIGSIMIAVYCEYRV